MGRLTIEQLWKRCDAMCEIEGRQGDVHGEVYKEYSSIRQYLKELQRYKDLEEQGRLIEVIRCKECRHEQYCKQAQYLGADGYCSKAEVQNG